MSKIILFQGDSVTDVGRRDEARGLGEGYPRMAADHFAESGENVAVVNRGISGNRSKDLVERWKADCLDIKPDLLTILIGINDVWRKYDSNDETPTEVYYANLEKLISQTRNKTNAEIILMEPFVLPCPEDRKAWRVTLDPEIQAVRELAMKYHTHLIPLDGILARAALQYGYTALCEDGVHPTQLGHRVIFKAWLEEYHSL